MVESAHVVVRLTRVDWVTRRTVVEVNHECLNIAARWLRARRNLYGRVMVLALAGVYGVQLPIRIA